MSLLLLAWCSASVSNDELIEENLDIALWEIDQDLIEEEYPEKLNEAIDQIIIDVEDEAYSKNLETDHENEEPIIDVSDENTEQSVDKLIANIKSEFSKINSNSDQLEVRDYSFFEGSIEWSGEGWSLFSYYMDDKLKKIVITYLWEMGKTVNEYYYNEDKLFFAFHQERQYNSPIYVDEDYVAEDPTFEVFDMDKSTIIENRHYFHDWVMIQWIDKDWQINREITEEYWDVELEIIKNNEIYLYETENS